MDNVTQNSVIRQLFSLIPLESDTRSVFDAYAKKFTCAKCILLFVAAQLGGWGSHREIESRLRAEEHLQELLQLPSISSSQLSRKLDAVPTEWLMGLFLQAVKRTQEHTAGNTGITAKIGRLHIIDSTTLKLPLLPGEWARASRKESSVKMHLRLVAASPDTVFPDAMVPSTKNVDDREVTTELVVESDTTYVMDRGYDDYRKMDQWVKEQIRFVIRIRDRAATSVVEEYAVPENSRILRDAKVRVGSAFRSMERPIRLVEYVDEQGRFYRVLTSCWDLSAEDVAKIYKSRWLIELFFKWVKQHLQLVNVYSYKPQAIWNQMLIVLLTQLLILHVRLTTQTTKTKWFTFRLLQIYLFREWEAFRAELFRKPTRTSKGRRPGAEKKPICVTTTIGRIKPSKVTQQ